MTSIKQSKERIDKLHDGDLREYAQGSYRHGCKLRKRLGRANKQLAQQGVVIKQLNRNKKRLIQFLRDTIDELPQHPAVAKARLEIILMAID